MTTLLRDYRDRLDVLDHQLREVLDLHGAVAVRTSIKALIEESKLVEPYAPEHRAFRKQANGLRREAEEVIGEFLIWTLASGQRRAHGPFGPPTLGDIALSRLSHKGHRWVKWAKQRQEPSPILRRAMERFDKGE